MNRVLCATKGCCAIGAGVSRRASASRPHSRHRLAMQGRPWRPILVAFAVLCTYFAWGGTLSRVGAADRTVWQLTPYRVRILVASEGYFDGANGAAEAFRTALACRLDSLVGAAWELTVAEAPPALRWAHVASLEDLTVESVLPASPAMDKIIVLLVTDEKGILHAAARELDVRTRQLGPVVDKTVWQRGKLRDAAVDAVLEAFTPLAFVDSVDLKTRQVILRLKAAALSPRDPHLVFVRPGTIFQPILRRNDRSGNPRQIQPVAWTFLVAESVVPEQVLCRMTSGMRTPLSVRRRARMEQLALVVRPSNVPSTIRLCARGEPKPPLAGYEIYEQLPDRKALTLLGQTDRQGRITIAPSEAMLRILLVKNGGRRLARLPLVPGLKPEHTAEIGSDDARLQAEGFLTGLQEEVMDMVARRMVLLARTRARIEAGELDQAGQLLKEIDALPDRAGFLRKLSDAEKRLVSSDPFLQRQIERLIADTRKLIEKFVETPEVAEMEKRLRRARTGKREKSEER